MAEIRRNRAKHKLAAGGVVSCIAGPFTPDIVDQLGPVGFDLFWFEGEHGPLDTAQIGDLTRACDLWGVNSIVRVNRNTPGLVYRTLDLGAQGIVVPHVNTADAARTVVEAAKYHPVGQRSVTGGRQSFGVAEFEAKANDESMVVVLIEDVLAVENLDTILEVDGIDVFFVAPGDLGQSMGYVGGGHPEVQAAVERTMRLIVAAGRATGTTAGDATAAWAIDHGAQFLLAAWMPWTNVGGRGFLDTVAKAAGRAERA